MRKPLTTKKTSTPRNPPGIHDRCAWYAITASTLTARTPSSAGRYPRRAVIDERSGGGGLGQVVEGHFHVGAIVRRTIGHAAHDFAEARHQFAPMVDPGVRHA